MNLIKASCDDLSKRDSKSRNKALIFRETTGLKVARRTTTDDGLPEWSCQEGGREMKSDFHFNTHEQEINWPRRPRPELIDSPFSDGKLQPIILLYSRGEGGGGGFCIPRVSLSYSFLPMSVFWLTDA